MKDKIFILIQIFFFSLCSAQEVSYKINVTYIDSLSLIKGEETIVYTNTTNDTLNDIFIHLYPNAYTHDHTSFTKQLVERSHNDNFYRSKDRGYIKGLSFMINGDPVAYEQYNSWDDVIRIHLPKKCAPKQKIEIYTPFEVKFIQAISRGGKFEKNGVIAAQWYPKIAKYANGQWYPMPYLDQGEYYSDFADYDVTVTLPQPYILASTGEPVVPDPLTQERIQFSKEFQFYYNDFVNSKTNLEQYLESNQAARYYLSLLKNKKSAEIQSSPMKTLQFKAYHVQDFTWVAHTNYLIHRSKIKSLDGHEIESNIYYLAKNTKNYKPVFWVSDSVIRFMERKVGVYKYPQVSVCDAGNAPVAGMEYPMLTTVTNGDPLQLCPLIAHELIHNWFYGMIANNERETPALDEGFTDFYERRFIVEVDHPLINPYKKLFHADLNSSYLLSSQAHRTQSNMTSSEKFTRRNYGNTAYFKTGTLLEYMRQYIGEESFTKAMRDYYDRHEYASLEGLIQSFRKFTSKNVDWFYSMMNSNEAVDFSLHRQGRQYVLKNKTGAQVPLIYRVYDHDSSYQQQVLDPFIGKVKIPAPQKAIVRIDDKDIGLDHNYTNNSSKKGIEFKLKESGTSRSKYSILAIPLAHFNIYDGIQLGGYISNALKYSRQNRLLFNWAGFYSRVTNSVTSIGDINYRFFPKARVHQIVLGTNFRSFHLDSSSLNRSEKLFNRYIKWQPYAYFDLHRDVSMPDIDEHIVLSLPFIQERKFGYEYRILTSDYRVYQTSYRKQVFFKAKYQKSNRRLFNPYSYQAGMIAHKDFVRLSVEGKMKLHYNIPRKGLSIRGFAGKLFELNENSNYWFFTSNINEDDYLREQFMLGRSAFKGLASQQIFIRDGGMKLAPLQMGSPHGFSNNWMTAVNITSDALSKWSCSVKPFVDIVISSPMREYRIYKVQSNYDAGLELSLYHDALKIYYPFFMSKEYRDYYATTFDRSTRILRKITWQLDLQSLHKLTNPEYPRWMRTE